MDSSNYTSVVCDLWVNCSRSSSEPRLRLFCFPYAGAGSSLFNSWTRWLPPGVEVYLVNLPGRDARIREEPCRQFDRLIGPLTQALLPYFDIPFVFFGHSMGSLISFELTRELRRRGIPQPLHLFVSGRQPPYLADTHPSLHRLPQEEFLKMTQQYYGALPAVILQDPELVNLFLSMMRADITMIETYEYKQEAPLDCPITVYGGTQDPSVDERNLAAWRNLTNSGFKLRMFPGEHFFIQTARQAVLQELHSDLARVLNGLEERG